MTDNHLPPTNPDPQIPELFCDPEQVVYHYDASGQRLSQMVCVGDSPLDQPADAECDSPIILRTGSRADEAVTASPPYSIDHAVYTYSALDAHDDATLRGRYCWTGREFDTDIALQYNRASRTPDPSQGQFLDEPD